MPSKTKSKVNAAGNYTKPTMRANLFRSIKAGGKGIYNVGKYATTTPSGLTFLGAPVAYQAGKYFLSDGKVFEC